MRLIDADNALELFQAEYQNTENLIKQGEKQLDSLAEGYTEAAHIIKHISPTVDAVPVVHGAWLLRHIGAGHYWECSVCHTNPCIYVTEHTKFCPNCGAQMDGDDDAKPEE